MTTNKNHQQKLRLRKLLATRRWGLIISGLVILPLIIVAIQHSADKKEQTKPQFTTMKVSSQPNFNLTGKIEPVKTQVLTLPSGKLQSLNVKNGDHVTQGQAILTMHNDNLENNIAELQSQLNTSSEEQSDNSSSQQRLNSISNKVNQTLTAPYSGYVAVDQSKEDAPVITLYSDKLQFVGQVSEYEYDYDYDKLHQSTDLRIKALATNHTANSRLII